MVDSAFATGTSRDLFGDVPSKRQHNPTVPRQVPSELASARALCAQLRRQQTRTDKHRIAHLISLNLIAMLRHAGHADTSFQPGLDS